MSVTQRVDNNTLAEIGLEEPTTIEEQVQEVTTDEVNQASFDNSAFKFRKQLSEKELTAVEASAPKISEKMVNDFNYIISFGSDVLDEINSINSRLLDEQKDVEIPEADAIVNNVLRELDGYSAKYGNPKLKNFIERMVEKMKGSTYTLKTMVRDAKPIAEKLDLAQKEIYKMELKLRDNVNRGHELRNATIKTLTDIVKILAIFEEVIEVTRVNALKMDETLNEAAKNGEDAEVKWEGETYTVNEFREIHAQYASALGEIEKTWFAWRQKFFLYTTNVVATRNIINSSFGLQRTCMRVRSDAIPAARSQLVVWQQAEQARQGAEMAERVNKGVDKLINDAAVGTATAVDEISAANQRNMLSEETILAVTDSLRNQFKSMVDAEREGRAVRARNLAVIQQSEAVLKTASDDARREMIENAMEVVRADANVGNKKDTDEVLTKLGVTE